MVSWEISIYFQPHHVDTGWWLTYPSEKYELVNWDDFSQYMGK